MDYRDTGDARQRYRYDTWPTRAQDRRSLVRRGFAHDPHQYRDWIFEKRVSNGAAGYSDYFSAADSNDVRLLVDIYDCSSHQAALDHMLVSLSNRSLGTPPRLDERGIAVGDVGFGCAAAPDGELEFVRANYHSILSSIGRVNRDVVAFAKALDAQLDAYTAAMPQK